MNANLIWLEENKSSFQIRVYVIPCSSKSEIVGTYGDFLKIKLKSPPIDGAANNELVRFLAEKLKVPKRNIEIVRGHKQKKKILLSLIWFLILLEKILLKRSIRKEMKKEKMEWMQCFARLIFRKRKCNSPVQIIHYGF